MKENTTETKTAGAPETPGFFDITEIEVALTYSFTEPPTSIRFFCKLLLNADDKAARQKFYSQPAGDMEAGQHAYYVDMLARTMTKRPEGLPGFDAFIQNRQMKQTGQGSGLDGIRAALIEYLGSPEPMKIKIAADAFERYGQITQPAEFFR